VRPQDAVDDREAEMGGAAKATWKIKPGGPTTVDALRTELTKLAKKSKGKDLISDKFTKDHVFAGHSGDVLKLAAMLARFREKALSTIMISSMDTTSQAEVLNWIDNVPAGKLTFSNGTWTVATSGTAVAAKHSYSFATVDFEAMKGMNADDIKKKSRNWLKESKKTPKVACQFGTDGTPLIYHLDY
jgi:hypothetical protein